MDVVSFARDSCGWKYLCKEILKGVRALAVDGWASQSQARAKCG